MDFTLAEGHIIALLICIGIALTLVLVVLFNRRK